MKMSDNNHNTNASGDMRDAYTVSDRTTAYGNTVRIVYERVLLRSDGIVAYSRGHQLKQDNDLNVLIDAFHK